MSKKTSIELARSLAGIAAACPSEPLKASSRYVILADLRMGDGGAKDGLFRVRRRLVDILEGWYLPRKYILVLAGDVEDLRRFWLKSIAEAWGRLYSVFDAFRDAKRLRKIVGDRDLALTLLRSYPYELCHGLRLDGQEGSFLVVHGHQASRPYIGCDYLREYLGRWQYEGIRRKDEDDGDEGARLKAERRLSKTSRALGLAIVEGHTRRPLFESRGPSEGYGPGTPALFCPGRLAGGAGGGRRQLRMMEIVDGRLVQVAWTRTDGAPTLEIEGRCYLRETPWSAGTGELLTRSRRSGPRIAGAEGGVSL
jgi:hypothetical protein